jgi:radical SAM superfamily enzyme YgiQ (UPF0313 family)
MSKFDLRLEPSGSTGADLINQEQFPALGPRIRVLMIWPRAPVSFWNFRSSSKIIPQRANIPPLGLLTIAALCPRAWTIRLIDQTFECVRDEDILKADLVMVSGMRVQAPAIHDVLARARALGRRTMIGGPFASSDPRSLLLLADHVVVGEPDAEFGRIAADLESGSARRLYVIQEKPDVTCTPVARFDLLDIDRYDCMAVEFSRGCPFQCEFCDIITIYGRKPRTKHSSQIIAELQMLFELGWRRPVFIVDNNFIANHRLALELAEKMQEWSTLCDYPFAFYTEASLDLAQRPALLDAMVRANFLQVFIGIESPSKEALKETKKFQNLRIDPLEAVRLIQQKGLWVLAGFIIGFDSDAEDIFERQIEFIERAGIPWAMLGFLQAMPTTPLYDRMLREGRLFEGKSDCNNFNSPNFRTVLPRDVLLRGVRDVLRSLYQASSFYERSLRSLEYWNVQQCQRPPACPLLPTFWILLRSVWYQGITSDYRRVWWKSLFEVLRRWSRDPLKLWWGCALLISGDHFIRYAREVTSELEREAQKTEAEYLGQSTRSPTQYGSRSAASAVS